MLKILKSIKPIIRLEEGGVGVGGNDRAKYDSKCKLGDSEVGGNEVDDSKVANDEVRKKDQKMSKSKKLFKSKKTVKSLDFLTFRARLAFIELKQAFVKALILYHFDLKRHIHIEVDKSGYAMGRVFSQLTLDNLGR